MSSSVVALTVAPSPDHYGGPLGEFGEHLPLAAESEFSKRAQADADCLFRKRMAGPPGVHTGLRDDRHTAGFKQVSLGSFCGAALGSVNRVLRVSRQTSVPALGQFLDGIGFSVDVETHPLWFVEA